MPAPAELIVTGPDGAVTRYKLGERAIVGRHPECEVVLTDPMSSRRHCKVERTPAGGFTAEDNGSANGTLLNGEPLRARTMIKNGDTLQIGSTLLVLRVEVAPQRDSISPRNQIHPTRATPAFDPSMSIVRLEDEAEDGNAPSVDFVQQADGKMVSDEEAASSDIAKLKRVTERLKLLIDVGQAMGTTLDPHKLLNQCLEKLFEVFPQADRGLVVLYGPDGSLPATLTPEKDQGATLDRRKGAITKVKMRNITNVQDTEIKLSRTVLKRVRTERQSVLVSDSSGDAAGLSMAKFEIKSLMCSPLCIGADDLGFIQLETKSRAKPFTPDDVSVMTAVASQVAVVMRNSDLALNAAVAAAQRENLSRFLSPQLVDEVLKGKLGVELGGVEKKGTIFFSDIVSFTKLASKMSAQSVVTLLNRYFTVMQNIIFRRGGSIDKCAGDNIMAHWGVVGDLPHFTAQAVTSSVEMQIALFAFNRDEARKAEIQLPPTPLGHGIGLNTGTVCAGNIGSDRKIEFTVIGDAVNLSARIEAMAGRGQTFVGEPTYLEIKARAMCVRMPDCPAKNVEKPLPIFSVRAIVPPDETKLNESMLRIDDMLFALPCEVACKDVEGKTAGMVTGIAVGNTTAAKLSLQIEKFIAPGTAIELHWSLPEKPSLPAIVGMVESCHQASESSTPAPGVDLGGGKGKTAVMPGSAAPGVMTILTPHIPPEIAAMKPGTLLQSDLKSHEEIVRA